MADRRRTITVKLTPGKDDDLIRWWKKLEKGDHTTPNGGKQEVAKRTLRLGIGLPQPQSEAPAIHITAQEAIEKLRDELYADLDRALSNMPTAADDAHERIQQLEQYIYGQLNEAAQHINDLYNRVDELMRRPVQPSEAAPLPPVEPASQVTDERLNERTKRLKKTTW